MPLITTDQLSALARDALVEAGAGYQAATITSEALLWADERELSSHGVARIPLYAAHLRNGRVNGQASPVILREKGAVAVIDAGDGLAYPACRLAGQEAIARAKALGVSLVAVVRSNHFGAGAWHLEPLAEAGLVGLLLGNSPAAIAPWGGKRALLGTNPIAAVFPRRVASPLSIDFSLSEVARGKIMVAKQKGESIPPNWALDAQGEPTTDPDAALAGSMLPAGGVKVALLALIVELLVGAVAGAAFSYEADSFFTETGNRASIGQIFLAIDPGALAGNDSYGDRIETLLQMIQEQPGVRLPGAQRESALKKSQQQGIEISEALLKQIEALATAHKTI